MNALSLVHNLSHQEEQLPIITKVWLWPMWLSNQILFLGFLGSIDLSPCDLPSSGVQRVARRAPFAYWITYCQPRIPSLGWDGLPRIFSHLRNWKNHIDVHVHSIWRVITFSSPGSWGVLMLLIPAMLRIISFTLLISGPSSLLTKIKGKQHSRCLR